MNPLQSIALLLSLCACSGYINQRFLHWPPVLAMTVLNLLFVVVMLMGKQMGWIDLSQLEHFVRSFDFSDLVLHGMLGPLLFAGAMFVNVDCLRQWYRSILSLATIGVVVAAFVTGGLLWGMAQLLGFELGFQWCLLFGALISPTDPIAALAIVRRAGAPKAMEIKLVGESLFNDGSGVMLFLIVLGFIKTGDLSPSTLAHEVFVAPVGAIALGAILGWAGIKLISKVDHHPTEILITLALATGVYGLAEFMHVSAPIAVVIAGLLVGHRGRSHAMTQKTREHLDSFWEGMDEVMNAILFCLIGLELILIDVSPMVVVLGMFAWVAVIAGRWAGVFGSLMPLRHHGRFGQGTMKVMVWGGLRGGISMALALSVPSGPEANIIVTISFIVVAMSASIQGLTLGKIIPKQVVVDNDDLNNDNTIIEEGVVK